MHGSEQNGGAHHHYHLQTERQIRVGNITHTFVLVTGSNRWQNALLQYLQENPGRNVPLKL